MKVYCTQAIMYCILNKFNGRDIQEKLANSPSDQYTGYCLATEGALERLYESVNIKHAIHNNKENYIHDFMNSFTYIM